MQQKPRPKSTSDRPQDDRVNRPHPIEEMRERERPITMQPCGGGYRILRKSIGGDNY